MMFLPRRGVDCLIHRVRNGECSLPQSFIAWDLPHGQNPLSPVWYLLAPTKLAPLFLSKAYLWIEISADGMLISSDRDTGYFPMSNASWHWNCWDTVDLNIFANTPSIPIASGFETLSRPLPCIFIASLFSVSPSSRTPSWQRSSHFSVSFDLLF